MRGHLVRERAHCDQQRDLREPADGHVELVSLPGPPPDAPATDRLVRRRSGSLGNVCSVSGATSQTCSSSKCLATSCSQGLALTSGRCVNLQSDPSNW